MKINDISKECIRWLYTYLNYMKLIGNINCVNGLSININATLRLNREVNQSRN